PKINISSAGTEDSPSLTVWPEVHDYLNMKGLDISNHRRRTLSKEIVESSDLIITMSTDHQAYLKKYFGIKTPLFSEVSGYGKKPLFDVTDIFQPDECHSKAAVEHIHSILDEIILHISKLSCRLHKYL
ncbi:MAG: hypothetical protein QNK40_07160, partial [Desulfobacterales bacterium]|nr:hypothetical protein [Desulfobacterales bacterium]MDX2508984.1 hypothetical protein [Desulfobacterales bacterium]